MEVYKDETQEIIRRFLAHGLSFPECVAALDAALAALIQQPLPVETMVRRSGSLDLGEIRAIMLANNQTIMAEMGLRGLHPPNPWRRSRVVQ
jgi:hypothetical protein